MIRASIIFLLLATYFVSTAAPNDHSTLGKPVHVQADSITFAIIGDYGADTKQEDSVVNMIKTWHPDFIVTVGDNNYTTGSAQTISQNIGKYYGDFIYNPDAPEAFQCHGKASQEKINRFFPSPGNHDNYSVPPLKPYLDYFTLPGDEKNYDFSWGPAHFYSINSGTLGKVPYPKSKTAKWFKNEVVKANQPFKFIYFHHPPYSGGSHGSSKKMRWPYHELGVDAVFCGHEHFYARATNKTQPSPIYLICGNSGTDEHYDCNKHPLDPSKFEFKCDNVHFGAIKVRLTAHKAIFEYFVVEDPLNPVDVYVINK